MEEVEVTVQKYKVTNVFDISQTEGDPIETLDAVELTAGVENYAEFLQAVEKVAPVPIRFDELTGQTKGYFHTVKQEIVIQKGMAESQTFCHNALVFAPDKTVLQSLREIITFDKNKVVPPEYARVLDANIKFHFLEETGTTLHTIDDSDFNIIISNTQKIIVKKKRKDPKPVDVLFDNGSLLSSLYGDMADNSDEAWDDASLMYNQRFKKLCRLPQLGVYVDEAHHLFGADLEKQIRAKKNDRTSLRATINMLAERTSIVACYNYTGTPYVNKQLLPEVVYAYGLKESIWHGYLKDADPIAFEEFFHHQERLCLRKSGTNIHLKKRATQNLLILN